VSLIEGKDLEDKDLSVDAEVVIVGSGAGGAVVAKELSEAGIDVVVLEEGPNVPASVYSKFRPTETLRHIGREAATTAVLGLGDTPIITVTAGRALGGSSLLTGGVCFRVPGSIHKKWVDRGFELLSERELDAAFTAVERESSVAPVPEAMRSLSTVKFAQGATKLGLEVKPIPRNTDGCVGYARCNFGCPVGAKMSVDRTYLPKALARGARIYTDVLVEEVVASGGKASGVRGRILGPTSPRGQKKRGRITVRAKTVVLAAGSIHTPLLLMRSGFRSPAVGRHLTLHPNCRVVARFDDEILGWRGALQSAYVDRYEDEGITLIGLFLPPNVLAAGLPGVGKSYADRIGQLKHLAMFGALVHDSDGGRVHRGLGREPLITYRLAKQDKASLIRGMKILCEIFFEAGAKEVYPPVFGMPTLKNMDDVRAEVTEQISGKRMECVTFHPLGTCRISKDPKDGVVDQWGRCHELEGVLVADGSVFPTSIGVNSQLPIMAMATRIAWRLRETLRS
jgi:choline dehydrogenase-like flavoprotein